MDVQDTLTQATKTMESPEFLEPLVDRLHSTGKAETVFGASREERGRTIVPVARVSYGFGGGFGKAGNRKTQSKPKIGEARADDKEPQADEGVGGGAGINVTPVGVFEVTEAGARFLPIAKSRVVAVSTFLAGVLLGMVVSRGMRR